MHRFFVSPAALQCAPVILTGPLAGQLCHVLRLRTGAHIVLLDGSGWAYEVELQAVTPNRTVAHIVDKWQPQTEPRVRLVLYQALLKEHKFDWVLQKGTELGVTAFVPLITERAVVRPAGAEETKLARWQRVVTEAAEQSGRARLPQVLPPLPFSQACAPPPMGTLAMLAWVSEGTFPLGQVLRTYGSEAHAAGALKEVRLYIGPEGDFTLAEAASAQQAGIMPISLGPRILRTETAGLVAFAAILQALGEFG
jgi:16S rRNA (uracil1498-N3)-methyltransferase